MHIIKINVKYIKYSRSLILHCWGAHNPDFIFIGLSNADIEQKHCEVELDEEKVFLHPCDGKCLVNEEEVTSPAKLHHGMLTEL